MIGPLFIKDHRFEKTIHENQKFEWRDSGRQDSILVWNTYWVNKKGKSCLKFSAVDNTSYYDFVNKDFRTGMLEGGLFAIRQGAEMDTCNVYLNNIKYRNPLGKTMVDEIKLCRCVFTVKRDTLTLVKKISVETPLADNYELSQYLPGFKERRIKQVQVEEVVNKDNVFVKATKQEYDDFLKINGIK